MRSLIGWAGIVLVVYLATAALYFFLSIWSRGAQGGYEAIETFFGYLSDTKQRDFADFLISIMQAK